MEEDPDDPNLLSAAKGVVPAAFAASAIGELCPDGFTNCDPARLELPIS